MPLPIIICAHTLAHSPNRNCSTALLFHIDSPHSLFSALSTHWPCPVLQKPSSALPFATSSSKRMRNQWMIASQIELPHWIISINILVFHQPTHLLLHFPWMTVVWEKSPRNQLEWPCRRLSFLQISTEAGQMDHENHALEWIQHSSLRMRACEEKEQTPRLIMCSHVHPIKDDSDRPSPRSDDPESSFHWENHAGSPARLRRHSATMCA